MQYFQWKNEPKYNIESMNWSKGPDNQRPFVKQKIIWSASASRELLINHEENDGLLLCTCPKREKKNPNTKRGTNSLWCNSNLNIIQNPLLCMARYKILRSLPNKVITHKIIDWKQKIRVRFFGRFLLYYSVFMCTCPAQSKISISVLRYVSF